MFHLNVILRVQDAGNTERASKALRRMRPLCLNEDGCKRWDLYQSETSPQTFILVEEWASKELWQRHLGADTITKIYAPEVLPFVEREIHPCKQLT